MSVRHAAWQAAGAAALALALVGSQGCSKNLVGKGIGQTLGNYVADRAKDMLDLVDVGMTFSREPQVSLYANGVSMGGAGFGMLEGHFAGIGGGNVGWVPIYTANMGAMVWCYEELAFGDYDKNDVTTVNAQGTGVIGLVAGPAGHPGWKPS